MGHQPRAPLAGDSGDRASGALHGARAPSRTHVSRGGRAMPSVVSDLPTRDPLKLLGNVRDVLGALEHEDRALILAPLDLNEVAEIDLRLSAGDRANQLLDR